jgi:phosphatidylethanolamine-binding protein (PEBP) family uncharacterized protein
MRLQPLLGSVSFLQFQIAVLALPTDQQPLQIKGSPDVQTVQAALREAEIIPTVIDDFLPSLTLSVSWKKGEADLGNTLKPKHLQNAPLITLNEDTSPGSTTDKRPTYIVTLTDPDAPSRDNPKWSEMCHWIATNVSVTPRTFSILPLPEHGLVEQDVDDSSSPDDVVEYKPPGPPPKTGKHRYVFLVFAPRNGTAEALHLSAPKDRQHWGTGQEGGGVRDWAEANELVPVAANFVYAKNKKQ